jgi:hypothetical protein
MEVSAFCTATWQITPVQWHVNPRYGLTLSRTKDLFLCKDVAEKILTTMKIIPR